MKGFSATTTKLGHWEREPGAGNPAVSMATAVLTQLLPPHLGKYTTIRKGSVVLCAGRTMKYPQSMSNSLLLSALSSAFHLSPPTDFGESKWISSPWTFDGQIQICEVKCETSFAARSHIWIQPLVLNTVDEVGSCQRPDSLHHLHPFLRIFLFSSIFFETSLSE